MDRPVEKLNMDDYGGQSSAQSYTANKQDKKNKGEEEAKNTENEKTPEIRDSFVSIKQTKPLLNVSKALNKKLKEANIDLTYEKDNLTQIIKKINKIDNLLKKEPQHPVYSFFKRALKTDSVARNLSQITDLISPYKHSYLSINPFIKSDNKVNTSSEKFDEKDSYK